MFNKFIIILSIANVQPSLFGSEDDINYILEVWFLQFMCELWSSGMMEG